LYEQSNKFNEDGKVGNEVSKFCEQFIDVKVAGKAGKDDNESLQQYNFSKEVGNTGRICRGL
jgi:hypothetical protein